jgi:hypothetical protein
MGTPLPLSLNTGEGLLATKAMVVPFSKKALLQLTAITKLKNENRLLKLNSEISIS